MPLIVIDGPEKAGKSTLIELLHTEVVPVARVRHHNQRPDPDHRQYAEWLSDDMALVQRGEYVVWDRSWLTEVVYNQLITDREGIDPFTAEWLYGRIVDACGIKVVLLGPSLDVLAKLRDETDHNVNPGKERAAFLEWGMRGNWFLLANQHDPDIALEYAREIVGLAVQRVDPTLLPPNIAGPLYSRAVVIDSTSPGTGLPFSNGAGFELAQRMFRLGADPLSMAWARRRAFPPQRLAWYDTVIACGKKAGDWARLHGNLTEETLIEIPHPSWLFRRGDARTAKARTGTDEVLTQLIKDRRI